MVCNPLCGRKQNAKYLETDSCDFVTDVDLEQSKALVWRYKGTPYTVEVPSVHGGF